MLIKLDSGDYMNTTFIEWIEKKSDGWLISMAADSVHGAATSADKDGIITPLVDKDSVTVTVKPRDGVLMLVTDFGTMAVTIWYCPACGRRIKAFIHEKQLPE